jgi:succinate dehydrogenase / fumarate reductase, cytochrome b subunit
MSSISKKSIVAITGSVLVLFIIVHLLGNLSIFLGARAINAYAHKLQSLGELLWIARFILLLCVVLHIYFTILLWRENRLATPQKYAVKKENGTTVYARLMRLSGLTVLAFVIYHLAQFTWQLFNPEYKTWIDNQGFPDVYKVVVSSFLNPFVSLFYILAVGLLSMHLRHGIASVFQTLGLSSQRLHRFFNLGARTISLLIFIGFASIPASVLLGLIKLPHPSHPSQKMSTNPVQNES